MNPIRHRFTTFPKPAIACSLARCRHIKLKSTNPLSIPFFFPLCTHNHMIEQNHSSAIIVNYLKIQIHSTKSHCPFWVLCGISHLFNLCWVLIVFLRWVCLCLFWQDGTTWFLNPPEQNLPLILADNGFDVWVVNTRGTRFSNKHVSIDPIQPEYWDWSWDELVAYDLPATFDFMSQHTGGQEIHYVGHSLGTLIALASFSEGQLVDKVKSVALLSPIAYLSHMVTVFGVMLARSFVGEMTALVGVAEFNLGNAVVAGFVRGFCSIPGVDCYDYLSVITGPNCCLDPFTVSRFLQNEPQPTSVKNMIHLAQTVRYGILSKFNYLRADYNLHYYGQSTPPIYNLSNIPNYLPLFLSYGGRDALSDVQDVGTLLDHLKYHDKDKIAVQFIEEYAHADFIMATNAKDMVYSAMINFFNRQ